MQTKSVSLSGKKVELCNAGTIIEHKGNPKVGLELLTETLKKSTRHLYLSRVVRKPAFCICENKDADQLRGNREADQRLCFHYIDSTISLLPAYKFSSL